MNKILLSLCAGVLAMTASAQTKQFVKLTSEPTDWTGEYLIVREVADDSTLVFDGAIADDLDAKNNCFLVMRTADIIPADETLLAATFTIALQGDTAYSCCSKSGLYFGYNSYKYDADSTIANTLKSGADDKYPLYLTYNADKQTVNVMAKCGYYLRYNDDPAHNRFRFHAEGKKKSICLYKLVEETTAVEDINPCESIRINGALYGLPEGIYIENGKLIYYVK